MARLPARRDSTRLQAVRLPRQGADRERFTRHTQVLHDDEWSYIGEWLALDDYSQPAALGYAPEAFSEGTIVAVR